MGRFKVQATYLRRPCVTAGADVVCDMVDGCLGLLLVGKFDNIFSGINESR